MADEVSNVGDNVGAVGEGGGEGTGEDLSETGRGTDRMGRTGANWPAALLVILLIASAVFGFAQWSARRRLEVAVGNQYFNSFFDLLGNVDNVRVALSKSLVSGSPPAHCPHCPEDRRTS